MIEKIINFLIESLESNNIPYCFLRNYEKLPEVNMGHDLDIQVAQGVEDKLDGIIDELCLKFNAQIIRKHKRQLVYQFYILYGGKNILVLDFHNAGEQYRGVIYLSNSEILSERIRYKNFFIPDPVHEALISLFSSLLWGGFIKKKYAKKIKAAFLNNHIKAENALKKVLGGKYASQIINDIIKGRYEKLEKDCSKYKRRMLLHGLIKNPISFIRNNILYYYYELIYRFKHCGIFIVLLGCDGSGKTTVCEEIKTNLKNLFAGEKVSFHWRPGILAQLSSLKSKLKNFTSKGNVETSGREGPVTEPHKQKEYNFFISFLRFMYYVIDYIIGYRLIIKIKAKDGVLLFDRYYPDMFIDSRRYRLKIPGILNNIFSPLVPKPDIILYLDSTPEELISRKGELSAEAYEELLRKYRNYVSKANNAYNINTNNGISSTIKICMSIIYQYVKKRDTIAK